MFVADVCNTWKLFDIKKNNVFTSNNFENYGLKALNPLYSLTFLMSLACHSHTVCMSLVCTRMSSVCPSHLLVCHPYVTLMYFYVIRMSLVCIRMSSVCHSHLLVCHLYVTHMYQYVIRISLVCTCMPSVCHSYILVCYLYVTSMYSYVIRLSLVYFRMSSLCNLYVLVCHPYVIRMYSYVIGMSLVCSFFREPGIRWYYSKKSESESQFSKNHIFHYS